MLAQSVVARVEGLRGRDRARPRAGAARPRTGGARRPAGVWRRRVPLPARSTPGRCSTSRATSSAARCATATTAGVIVETEAYHQSEPACHAYVGVTARTHVAVRAAGRRLRLPLLRHPRAVQRGLRARGRGRRGAHPRARAARGIDTMRARRGLTRPEQLCSGPGKLTQALAIELGLNGDRPRRGPVRFGPRPRGWGPSRSSPGPGSGSRRRRTCRGGSARSGRARVAPVAARGGGRAARARRVSRRAAVSPRPAPPAGRRPGGTRSRGPRGPRRTAGASP